MVKKSAQEEAEARKLSVALMVAFAAGSVLLAAAGLESTAGDAMTLEMVDDSSMESGGPDGLDFHASLLLTV